MGGENVWIEGWIWQIKNEWMMNKWAGFETVNVSEYSTNADRSENLIRWNARTFHIEYSGYTDPASNQVHTHIFYLQNDFALSKQTKRREKTKLQLTINKNKKNGE